MMNRRSTTITISSNGTISEQIEIPYYSFSHFENTGIVKDAFSTRFGGVSEGYLSSMNLGTTRGDKDENLTENFRRMGEAIGIGSDRMVLSHQTHTTNIKVVTSKDAGNGITRSNEFNDIDGMITNEKNLCLVTSFADCVPLYFVDPVKKVIGLSHSGWRGTVGFMGLRTVEAMTKEFDCNPKDILGAIGPSICQKCYEVSEDVAVEFENAFEDFECEFKDSKTNDCKSINGQAALSMILEHRTDNPSKYQLNLWKANEFIMLKAGLKPENIEVSEICTCENSDIFFSHRATNGKRGNVCAFLYLL